MYNRDLNDPKEIRVDLEDVISRVESLEGEIHNYKKKIKQLESYIEEHIH
ncbi:hypothetical protein [uncultured Algibacter sp.]|nr:hypothetical protein [uncultured Algibacter sp.]